MCTQCMQFIVCVYLNSSFKTHCIELGGKATSQVYEDIEQALFFFVYYSTLSELVVHSFM